MKPVLFAGADATDRGILQYVQREAGTSLNLLFARTPAEAIDYLNGEGRFADRHLYPLPEILVVDLTKPRMDFWQMVDWVRARPQFRHLRICFIGPEHDEKTALKASRYGRCFFTKPEDANSYKELVEALNAGQVEHAGSALKH